LKNWPQAVDDYEKCLEAEPNNKDFIDKLKKSREKMLSSSDFQTNEKRSMKKVQIQEDSSDGEDVDFGGATANTASTPTSKVTATVNEPKSSPAQTQPIIEKMTEDEQDVSYLSDMTTSKPTSNGLGSNQTIDPEQRLKEQEARVKSFISQYSSHESSQVNLMSINKPISELKEAFEKMYITYMDEKNKCLEVMKTGD